MPPKPPPRLEPLPGFLPWVCEANPPCPNDAEGPTPPIMEPALEALKTCVAHAPGAISTEQSPATRPTSAIRPRAASRAPGRAPGRARTSSTTAAAPRTSAAGASHGRKDGYCEEMYALQAAVAATAIG